MRKLLSFLVCIIFATVVFAQDREADSLKTVIENSKDDTSKVNSLIALSKIYVRTSPENALNFTNLAIRLSKRLDYKRGEALALKFAGIANFTKSNYLESINNWQQAMAIFDSIRDKAGVANIQSNIGNVYMNQGDDSRALEYFFSALKTGEEINDSLRMCSTLNNIAVVYQNKRNTWNKAVSFYLRALAIAELINEKAVYAASSTGLGEYYMNRDSVSLDSAIYYTKKSMEVNVGTVDEPYTTNLLGQIYQKKREFDKAIALFKHAYDLSMKFESQYDLSISYLRLAQVYKAKGENKLALETYKGAEAAAITSKSNYLLKEIYEDVASVYGKLHDYSNAYKYQYLLTGIKDSIYNIDTDKKLQGIQFTFDLAKKEGQINLLTKDQEIQKQEIHRQKLVRNGFVGGFAVVLLFAGVFFNQRNRISKEKKRSDELLLNILPSETAEELKATGTAKTKSFDAVTVMFTDFKNFTQASELLTPEELVSEINHCYSEFDKIVTKYGIEKIKTIGDAYMCAGGLPVTNLTHPFDVVLAGLEMQNFITRNKAERMEKGQPFFELRLGIHTGPVVAGIVGIKKFAYDIWGDTVNTASRMESSGVVGKVNISGFTYDLVKDKFDCTHRGKIEAKNKGQIDMYFVENSK